MINRDFHGYTVDDAVQEMHNVIGEVRNKNKHEEAHIITGHGVIQKELMSILKDTYKLEPQIQLGNSGVIIVNIE